MASTAVALVHVKPPSTQHTLGWSLFSVVKDVFLVYWEIGILAVAKLSLMLASPLLPAGADRVR